MVLKKPFRRLCRCFPCLFILLMTVHPLSSEASTTTTVQKTKKLVPSTVKEAKGIVGWAVYYKRHYHGKRTHSGAIYNERKLTAAHASLPHGTKVKVVNLANKRSVVVTITDRCRKRAGELIDLSREAARKLGFLGNGRARVQIIRLHG